MFGLLSFFKRSAASEDAIKKQELCRMAREVLRLALKTNAPFVGEPICKVETGDRVYIDATFMGVLDSDWRRLKGWVTRHETEYTVEVLDVYRVGDGSSGSRLPRTYTVPRQ